MSCTTEQLQVLRAMAVQNRAASEIVVPDSLLPEAVCEAAGVNKSELARFLGVHQSMLTAIQTRQTKKPFTYIAALKRVGLWVE